jgi:hypothetical protein
MRVVIKVKKDKAQGLLTLLKFRGFKPEPDRPVTIDFRMSSSALIGDLADDQLEFTRKIPEVESVSVNPAIVFTYGTKS